MCIRDSTSPLLPADAAFSETENGLFSPVSALCQTQYGPVKGREGENGQLCWYGIPYGAAPTGESRWTAPQEPARWLTVRDLSLIHIWPSLPGAISTKAPKFIRRVTLPL